MKIIILFLFVLVFNINATNLTLNDGTTYKNYSVIKTTAKGVLIRHDSGLATINSNNLPDDLKEEYSQEIKIKKKELLKKQKALKEEQERNKIKGNDLEAWKLAKKQAKDYCYRMSQVNPNSFMKVPKGLAEKGSRVDYALSYNANLRVRHEIYKLKDIKPTINQMTKTDKNNWSFIFPVEASLYDIKLKRRVPRAKEIEVKVVMYGNALKVKNYNFVKK